MGLPTPNTRKEQYLNAIATGNSGGLPTPITREEEYLDAIAKSGGGSGDGDMKKSVYDSNLAVANAGGISAFVSDAISGKVDKVEGKGLSTNDYDNTEKGKVADNASAIEAMTEETGACNLLPNNIENGTHNDVVISTNTDKTITANGTNTGTYLDLTIGYVTLGSGEYYFSGCPSGGDWNTTYSLWLTTNDGSLDIKETGTPQKFTLTSIITARAHLVIRGGCVCNNVTFKPMIHDARLHPLDYIPYAMTNRELTERVSNSYTSVMCDGVKTTQQVLNELYSLVDRSRVSAKTRIAYVHDNSTFWFMSLSALTPNRFRFDGITDADNSTIGAYHIQLSETVGDCSHIADDITNNGIQSSDISLLVQSTVYSYRVYY